MQPSKKEPDRVHEYGRKSEDMREVRVGLETMTGASVVLIHGVLTKKMVRYSYCLLIKCYIKIAIYSILKHPQG